MNTAVKQTEELCRLSKQNAKPGGPGHCVPSPGECEDCRRFQWKVEMDTTHIMRAVRAELRSHGRDIAIDHLSDNARTESLVRFEEFVKLCKRIEELARPIKGKV